MWRSLLAVLAGLAVAGAQVAWTPIYVDGSNQVDIWTQSVSGCACAWDASRRDCACCARDGACPCSRDTSSRCTQCGLEPYCANKMGETSGSSSSHRPRQQIPENHSSIISRPLCNMTIDARAVRSKSGRSSGQIKSPSLEGPVRCTYRLQPAAGQRVELQLYRLVSAGHHNGSRCVGGGLRLGTTELCGVNERYAPPVVLFSDHGDTMLIFEITEKTSRSQFLAYYSFTALSNTQGVGFQPIGGTRITNTDCDWLYQDVKCRGLGGCVAASSGYPGLYPPRARCRYLIAISSVHTRVRLNFTAVLLPQERCSTDYLAVYQGVNNTDPLLIKVCESRPILLDYPGPNLLLEFSSGDHVPPYDYNGFMATIEFYERAAPTPPPPPPQPQPPDEEAPPPSAAPAEWGGCHKTVLAARDGRSGHFDTRTMGWSSECRLTFHGKPTDVVHISLFNYKLKAPSCRSVIEILDGDTPPGSAPSAPGQGPRALLKLCSPAVRQARDESGHFVGHGSLVSKGPALTLVLRRSSQTQSSTDMEFLDGAYNFHDEQVAGTLQPGRLCEAQYYGLSSASSGSLGSPDSEPLFWNVRGPIKCRHTFVPGADQSVTVAIQSLGKAQADRSCQTACGDSGCECRTGRLLLEQVDHVLLMAEGHVTACLCGDFKSEWLPVSLRSWSTVQLVYSVVDYSFTNKGFTFGASYKFNDDNLCGHNTVTTHSGEIHSKDLSSMGTLNSFYHQHCTWILDSNVERQLSIEVSTNQSRPCVAWNISIHEYSPSAEDQHHAGTLLHSFCPREAHKQLVLPFRLNTVVVRVLAMSRTPPVYHVRWKSRAGPGGPAPPAAANRGHQKVKVTAVMMVMMIALQSLRIHPAS